MAVGVGGGVGVKVGGSGVELGSAVGVGSKMIRLAAIQDMEISTRQVISKSGAKRFNSVFIGYLQSSSRISTAEAGQPDLAALTTSAAMEGGNKSMCSKSLSGTQTGV